MTHEQLPNAIVFVAQDEVFDRFQAKQNEPSKAILRQYLASGLLRVRQVNPATITDYFEQTGVDDTKAVIVEPKYLGQIMVYLKFPVRYVALLRNYLSPETQQRIKTLKAKGITVTTPHEINLGR